MCSLHGSDIVILFTALIDWAVPDKMNEVARYAGFRRVGLILSRCPSLARISLPLVKPRFELLLNVIACAVLAAIREDPAPLMTPPVAEPYEWQVQSDFRIGDTGDV
jgi:hypothetical protein